MKKSIKATTALAPVPVVMVSCGDGKESNIITLAWVGTVNSEPPILSISVRYGRHSYPIIKERGEFTVNLVSRDLVEATDICGVISGKDEDKFDFCHFTKGEGIAVRAPYIEECPVALECKVVKQVDFGTHAVFFGEILNVIADEQYVNEHGTLSLPEGLLAAYSGGKYVTTGEALGSYGFTAKKIQRKK